MPLRRTKTNAGETRAIRNARPSAFRPTWWSGQERFDKIPQRIGKQRRGHTRSRYFADEDQVSAVLLHALRMQERNADVHAVPVASRQHTTIGVLQLLV